MTRAELVDGLRAAALVYVPVRRDGDPGSGRTARFDGAPGEFFATARELGVRAVFVSARAFEDADFHRPGGVPADDLRASEPALKAFEARVGEDAAFSLVVRVEGVTVELVSEQPWWREFLALRDRTAEALDAADDAAEEQEFASHETAREAARVGLAALLDNADFQALPTQAAMQAFAYDNVPGLDALDPRTVKAEVGNLRAKLTARGLAKRR